MGLELLEGSLCRVCGLPLISEQGMCTRCRDRNYLFESHSSLYAYRGAARELLYQYKFAGQRRLARYFAGFLAQRIREIAPCACVVPVPPRPGFRRRQGWEHVEEIARVLELREGLTVCRCLRRGGGAQQKELDFASRLENLSGSISSDGAPLTATAVVVDDVFTTGATLHECARVLREAGARCVHGVSIAIDE